MLSVNTEFIFLSFCQGFYSVSGSSLSDSCYSVSSDAAQGGPAPPARPVRLWEQVPLSADNTDILWSEGAVQQQQQQLQQQEQHQQEQEQEQPVLQNSQEEGEPTEGTPVSGELVQIMEPYLLNPSK